MADVESSNPLVVVRQGNDAYEQAREALRGLGLPDLSGQRVLVKPNVGRLAKPGDGVTTNPEVVAAVLDEIIDRQPADLAVGESPILGVTAMDAFDATGVGEVAEARGVTLLDLDERRPVTYEIPDGVVVKKLRVCAAAAEADFVVSVPVMKTHMHTQVSLSVKNMKGVLWRRQKVKLHQSAAPDGLRPGVRALDVAIADMATVVRADLAVIDGSVGMEGLGPSAGSPKSADLIVAGTDGVAADAVAVTRMGFEPDGIHHLAETAARGVGTLYPTSADVDPPDYARHTVPFAPPPEKISIEYPNVVVHDQDSCSACLSTTLMFLERHLSEVAEYSLGDGKLHLAIGKHTKPLPDGTILIGNCTAKQQPHGVWVQGCPPVASDILKRLREARERRS